METNTKGENSLITKLNNVLKEAGGKAITFGTLIEILPNSGLAVLLILLSLPFCSPIQIPGLSTPFGILLAYMGLKIAFGKGVKFPKMLMNRNIPYPTLQKIVSFTIKMTNYIKFFLHPRLEWLIKNYMLQISHGLTIFVLAIILSLPLPIPFTNMLSAFPIFAFGLAILNDDGVFILVAYILTLLCFAAFIALFWFGKALF